MKCSVYLGTHMPNWLEWSAAPLFISHRRLMGRKSFPRARAQWALDSGGFSELSLYGAWQTSPREYVAAVRRYSQEIGQLRWAAIQDWMCEPFMLDRTGLSMEEHQRRTVASYEDLLGMAPDLPWAPVIQGWSRDDYLRCLDMYAARGFDLREAPIVGIGSVCRRQHTKEAEGVIRELADMGLQLHGFGFKVRGLQRVGGVLASSDSMAWSFDARRSPKLPGCAGHKNCANCPRYAMRWLSELHVKLGHPPEQLTLQLAA